MCKQDNFADSVIYYLQLCIMFLKRSERYNRYWVRNIVYAVVLYERGINVEDKKKANL